MPAWATSSSRGSSRGARRAAGRAERESRGRDGVRRETEGRREGPHKKLTRRDLVYLAIPLDLLFLSGCQGEAACVEHPDGHAALLFTHSLGFCPPPPTPTHCPVRPGSTPAYAGEAALCFANLAESGTLRCALADRGRPSRLPPPLCLPLRRLRPTECTDWGGGEEGEEDAGTASLSHLRSAALHYLLRLSFLPLSTISFPSRFRCGARSAPCAQAPSIRSPPCSAETIALCACALCSVSPTLPPLPHVPPRPRLLLPPTGPPPLRRQLLMRRQRRQRTGAL